MAAESEYSVVVLQDEQGDDMECALLDVFSWQEREFVILLPVEDANRSEMDLIILETFRQEDGTERYVSIADDAVLQAVYQLFMERALSREFQTE